MGDLGALIVYIKVYFGTKMVKFGARKRSQAVVKFVRLVSLLKVSL